MISCVVPFCPAVTSRGKEGQIWFCGHHWSAISPTWRRVARRLARRDGYWTDGLVGRLLDEAIFGTTWTPKRGRR